MRETGIIKCKKPSGADRTAFNLLTHPPARRLRMKYLCGLDLFDLFADLAFNFFSKLRVVDQQLFHCFAALA